MAKLRHIAMQVPDLEKAAAFYETVFDCQPIPPERNLSGDWLDRATGLKGAHLTGVHLRLPGYDDEGPTLEIFQYGSTPERSSIRPNTPGFSHIAFAVDDVATTAEAVLRQGGSAVGELTEREIPGVGRILFQYLSDPEDNIIEIQAWTLSES